METGMTAMNGATTLRGLLGAGVLMLLVATGAGAQDPGALERIRAALPADQAAAVEAVLTRARERNIPVQPLVDKALEGMAKHAPPPLVVRAMEQLSQQLGEAQALLRDGQPPSTADVAAVADALRRGVPQGAVRSLRAQRGPGQPIALAVHTLGDLLDRGVPVDGALDALNAWNERGASADDLREMPAAVDGLIRRGVMPGEAASAVASAMRAGMPPGAAGPPDHAMGKGKAGAPGMTQRPPVPPGSGPPSGRPDPGTKGKPPGHGPPPI